MKYKNLFITALFAFFSGIVLAQNCVLSIPDVNVQAGKAAEISINLSNTTDIVGLEFGLTVGEGVVLNTSEASLTSRAAAHSLKISKVKGSTYKAMIFSSSNAPIVGNNGAVLTIPVVVSNALELGTVVPMQLQNVIISDRTGNNLTKEFIVGSMNVTQSFDLQVSNVKADKDAIMPLDTITVNWKVANVGDGRCSNGWVEYVYLVSGDGKYKLVGKTFQRNSLESNAELVRSLNVVVPQTIGFSGTTHLQVQLSPNQDENRPSILADNCATGTQDLQLGRLLTITPAKFKVEESKNPVTQILLSRSGSTETDEVFTLSCTADERLQYPETVTIPKGRSGAYFKLRVKANNTIDPFSSFALTGVGNDYPDFVTNFEIEDDVKPVFTLTADSLVVAEGDTLQCTLDLASALANDLTVYFTTDKPTSMVLPSSVTVPAGTTSVRVPIATVDNDVPETDQTVSVIASADGYQPTEMLAVIIDNDIPAIEMTLSQTEVGEGDGPLSVKATIRRKTHLDKRITIRLTDNSDNGIFYETNSVEMAKGTEEVSVYLGPKENSAKDGKRDYEITAAVYLSSCSCSASNDAGAVTVPITVYDNDGDMLLLSSNMTVLDENTEAEVLLALQGTDLQGMEVALQSENTDALDFPATINFGQGETEKQFKVKLKPSAPVGTRLRIAARALGFGDGIIDFLTSKDKIADARIIGIEHEEGQMLIGDSVTVRATVLNGGTAELPAGTEVVFHINSKGLPLVYSGYLSQSLQPAATAVVSVKMTAPSYVGNHEIYAIVNGDGSCAEANYNNNTSPFDTVTVASPFVADVVVDKKLYNRGDTVRISGTLKGERIANTGVQVKVYNLGTSQTLSAMSDENGAFQVDYIPFDKQIGHFEVGASHPGDKVRLEQCGFDIYGMRLNSAVSDYILTLDSAYTGYLLISNPGRQKLTNVAFMLESDTKDCEMIISNVPEIPAGESVEVPYSLIGRRLTVGSECKEMRLHITSAEGACEDKLIRYMVMNPVALLSASVQKLEMCVSKNSSRKVQFDITNKGMEETGVITLSLPFWLKSEMPLNIPSLAPGESRTIYLSFFPTEKLVLNSSYGGNIEVACENGRGLNFSCSCKVVPEDKGYLKVDVCDEMTYYADDHPHVSNADVKIKDLLSHNIVASGKTGDDGTYFVELLEGLYEVEVSAPNHETITRNMMVEPSVTKSCNVELSYQAITFSWNVEESEIEDQYEIVTTAKFSTNIPVPQVIISMPNSIDGDSMEDGETKIVMCTVTNKGCITAKDVIFTMPENTDEWEFTALADISPQDLPAQQSMLVPIAITRHLGSSSQKANSLRAPVHNPYVSCMIEVSTYYKWTCGTELKYNKAYERMTMKRCARQTILKMLTNRNNTEQKNNGEIIFHNRTDGAGSRSNNGYVHYPVYTGTHYNICNPADAARLEALENFAWNEATSSMGLVGEILSLFRDGEDVAAKYTQHLRDTGKDDPLYMLRLLWDGVVSPRIRSLGLKICRHYSESVISGANLPDNLTQELLRLNDENYSDVELMISVRDLAQEMDEAMLEAESDRAEVRSASPQSLTFSEVTDRMVTYLSNLIAHADALYGDKVWYAGNRTENMRFFEYWNSHPDSSVDDLKLQKPSHASDQQVEALYERVNNFNNGIETDNSVSLETMERLIEECQQLDEESVERGYSSLAEHFAETYEYTLNKLHGNSSSVCASVTLQFSQSMVMTRQAFRGTLTVFNGHESVDMKDVKLFVTVKDESGNIATSHEFAITLDSLSNFSGEKELTSGWSLAANTEGKANVLFIPTRFAAPDKDRVYSFGGTISFINPFTGLKVETVLDPVMLTVKPSPNLNLTYFMQRDVVGDNPLTPDAIEPSKEAEFSLLISNVGNGDATNVRMTTEQPRIVENQKGLDIAFELMSSQLNGGEKSLALGEGVVTDFGDIPAHESAYAQWWLKSSLLGKFVDYDVTATHVSSYGNPDLSLLNDVTIHELIHSLDVTNALRSNEGNALDTIAGFMVNDIDDFYNTPDMLYLSNGDILSVDSVKSAVLTQISPTQYMLTVKPSVSGWNYGRVIDPTYGMAEIKSIRRNSDQHELSPRNFWQTDCVLLDGQDPSYVNYLHFADDFTGVLTSETYILEVSPVPDTWLAVDTVIGLPEDAEIATSPIECLKVVFNKPVQPETFTSDDIALYIQGEKQNAGLVNISSEDNRTFVLDFSLLNETSGNGYHSLRIQTEGITDTEGFKGSKGKAVNWIMFRDALVKLVTSSYPESSGVVSCIKPSDVARIRRVNEYNEANSAFYADTVVFRAIPEPGYVFSNWTIDGDVVSTDSVYYCVALNDIDIVANFVRATYNVVVDSAMVGGTIAGFSSGVYEHGSEYVLSAAPDDDFIFSHWLVDGENVGTDDSYKLIVDGPSRISACFTREYYSQKLPISAGWTWISNCMHESTEVEWLSSIVNRVVGQDAELYNDPVLGFTGNLSTVDGGKSYKVYASSKTMLSFQGRIYSQKDLPLVLQKGWNWIAYPYFEERTLQSVLSQAEEGDYITAQTGYAEYSDGSWEGTIDRLVPGMGYIYKSSSLKELSFDFDTAVAPEQTKVKENVFNGQAEPGVDIHKYPNTMNVTARLVQDGRELADDEYIIYAIANNEIRGVSKKIGDNYYITIYGETPDDIAFYIENVSTSELYTATAMLKFTSDVIGSRRAPYIIPIGSPTDISEIELGDGEMAVYSVQGVLVRSKADAESLRHLPKGVYIINGKKTFIK